MNLETPKLAWNVQKFVNKEFCKVQKWLEANRLALNIDDTNFVIVHSQQRKITDLIVLRIGKKKDKTRVICEICRSFVGFKFIMMEVSFN